jgi:hypothetical protein
MVGPVFREKRYLAYLLNALVVAVVIIASVQVFLEGFEGMETWAIVLVFALPEAASIFLVRMELDEARKFERAFKKRREALDIEEGK